MQIKTQEIHISLGEAVRLGFSKNPKSVSSMFLYDAEGDRLFQEIMKMPEYYLTRCEEEIFHTHKEQILKEMRVFKEPFNLLEFGAGDGVKPKFCFIICLKTAPILLITPLIFPNTFYRNLSTGCNKRCRR